jgi:hypothetical protein
MHTAYGFVRIRVCVCGITALCRRVLNMYRDHFGPVGRGWRASGAVMASTVQHTVTHLERKVCPSPHVGHPASFVAQGQGVRAHTCLCVGSQLCAAEHSKCTGTTLGPSVGAGGATGSNGARRTPKPNRCAQLLCLRVPVCSLPQRFAPNIRQVSDGRVGGGCGWEGGGEAATTGHSHIGPRSLCPGPPAPGSHSNPEAVFIIGDQSHF